jgi:hypothetical protein
MATVATSRDASAWPKQIRRLVPHNFDTAAGLGELNPNPPPLSPDRKTIDAKDLSRV